MALAAPPPSPSPSFACRFVPRKCKHEQLFLDSYLRTNRTNHTKIMRCFPHCCPCHRKRSYCGSPLFVQFDHRTATHRHTPALFSDELVVFGRFRPLTASDPALRIGARVPLASIESSLQRDDPSSGEWVEAELSHSTHNSEDGCVSWVFEVNASARWYYPWGGAATIALRATEHVFEVLVFRRVDARHLELLAEAASTKFRLMSFRRGVTTTSASDNETRNQAALAPKTDSDEAPLKASPRSTPKNGGPTRKRTRPADTEETKPKLSPKAAPVGCLPRAPSPTSSSFTHTPLALSHPSLRFAAAPVPGAMISSLGALALWLDEMPISSAGSRRLEEWEQVVMNACVDACAPARGSVCAVRRPLTSILSPLHVSNSRSPTHVRQCAPSPLEVIDATVRTLLYLSLDPECAHLSHSLAIDTTHTCSRDQFVASYTSWLRETEYQARKFADAGAHTKWSGLMATATVLQHQTRASSARSMDSFGYRSFVAQRREHYAQQQLRRADSTRAKQRRRLNGFSISTLVSAKAPVFSNDTRVWVSRWQDVAMDATAMSQSLSLLSLLQFWRNLSCLRLEYSAETPSGQAAQFCLASVFNATVADECFTRLTLDGRYRWFHCQPSGDATTGTTLMGYVAGDYIGRATSVGTVHVTTFLWPTAATPSIAYAWHWTIDTASLASSSATTMSVVVESAPVHQHRDASHSFETMAIADKLRCVGRWMHACQAQLRFHAHY